MTPEEVRRRDLIVAFRCCLDPDFDTPPTSVQKQMILDELKSWGYWNTNMYQFDISPNDLFFREGRRSIALAIMNVIKQDPLSPIETKVEDHGKRSIRRR